MLVSGRPISANLSEVPALSAARLSPIPDLNRIEVHIIVGCSDSRDLSTAFNSARESLMLDDLQKGRLIEVHRESVAGTFITPDIVAGIHDTIIDRVQTHHLHRKAGVPLEIFVHVMSHGNVRLKDEHLEKNDPLRGTIHSIVTETDCPTNCGMMHAEEVAEELELQLLKDQPRLPLLTPDGKRQRTVQIKSQEDIKRFVESVYGYHALISAGFVKSISNLPRHACEQKLILRDAFNRDPSLRHMRINITAGVQNYEDHTYYRVDTNFHLGETFIDRIYKRMQKGPIPDAENRVARQAPVLGLFHPSGMINARATAMALYAGSPYEAGQVFALGEKVIGDFTRPFEPYKLIGFYYAVKHLNLAKWMVLGGSEDETNRIMMRISEDPLMSYIVDYFNVELLPESSPGMGEEELMRYAAGEV